MHATQHNFRMQLHHPDSLHIHASNLRMLWRLALQAAS
jgi:hypothetical protein